MILGAVSLIDCVVFLIFLAPQLLLNVGLFETATWVVKAVPHLAILMPLQFVNEQFFTPKHQRSPFVQKATLFQDIVIRCVRYAFANMPAKIGRVFFSKPVSVPFTRFRMLRHGYLRSPFSWTEVKQGKLNGVWLIPDQSKKPDIVVYYCHGGGFAMGSSYFYTEFLVAWITLLQQAGYKNPALFALEYTLAPDACYPTQVQQAFAGYQYVLSVIEDSAKVVVGGDSAGATIILSLLLYLVDLPDYRDRKPGLATMISPWVTLVSRNNRNTDSDYLDASSLEVYGRRYAGTKVAIDDPMVSPGNCRDRETWAKASPSKGWFFTYGSEEVLGPEVRNLVALLKEAKTDVATREEPGDVHAWPVAALYLGQSIDERLRGLRDIVKITKSRI